MEINKKVSENIARIRKSKGMTQSDVAKKLNYSFKSVSKWETGEVVPSLEIIQKLSEILEVEIGVLLGTAQADEKKHGRANKMYVSLLCITFVWILATIVTVVVSIALKRFFWYPFIWALPTTAILALIFNCIWGKTKRNYFFASLLVWTVLLALCLQLYKLNIWLLLLVGIPAQIAILFWSKIFNRGDK